ncbi:glycosyltransferase involved in cell wall biosynthesis [Pelomonas saccharophila]|uniref:Glycosyltransferase involved in cell wall biosynthesis n=1 Tax=Roseateles saccharophilus TaxID=304 RepID=A0ABU1YW15_ROSSA|nr:glycosyltransferase [Roseateles saccharophilus]MDR7272171.1 glycosyltransferase involved in cell wall biosynthesis [Roseateles saccharophilus]
MQPFFSIVMATHNRPLTLARAIASLRAQTCADFEILLVADALDAETAAVVARDLGSADSFLKRTGPNGPAESRNQGLAMARGEWVIFLDDDDTLEPHHLATLKPHCERADAQVLFTDITVVTEDRQQPGIPELSRQTTPLAGVDVNTLWVKNFIPLHCLAYRRSLLQGLSFDAHLASQEDWDWLLGVCSRAQPRHVPGGGAVMHKDYVNPGARRGQQESSNNTTVVLDFLHVYRRWPAPTAELKTARAGLLKSVGLALPVEWF